MIYLHIKNQNNVFWFYCWGEVTSDGFSSENGAWHLDDVKEDDCFLDKVDGFVQSGDSEDMYLIVSDLVAKKSVSGLVINKSIEFKLSQFNADVLDYIDKVFDV